MPAICVAVLLSLATAATFLPAFNAELVHWDDDINIFANPHIQQLDWQNIRWMFTDVQYTPRYRPLNWLAWATLIHFFGFSGPAFHAYLVALHVINTVLVFMVVRKLLVERMPNDGGSWKVNAAIGLATAVWALHPLRAEVVGWANCVIYAQSLFFLLLSLLFYLGSSREAKTPFRGGLCASLLCYIASLLTYPTALGWVVVLFVLDIFALRRFAFAEKLSPQNRAVFAEKVLFGSTALVVGAVNLFARATMSGIWSGMSDLSDFGWFSRVMQAFYVWDYYLWKTWLPMGLSPVYTRLVSFNPLEATFLISAGLILGLTVLFTVRRRSWPLLLTVWISHLVLLVPMLGLTEHPHYTNDRYSYIVGILWPVLIGAALLFSQHKKARVVFGAAAVLAVGLFPIMSFRQVAIWHDSETLFRSAIARLGDDPYRCDLHWRLGLLFANQSKNDAAIDEFSEALRINPKMVRARSDLAGVLVRQNKLDEAAAEYREVLRIAPKYPEANYNLGIVLAQQGHPDEAAQLFFAATALQPDNAEAHFQYGRTLAMTGKIKEALSRFREAARLKPDFVPALLNLSLAHAELRQWNDAVDVGRRALKFAAADKQLAAQIEEQIQRYEHALHESSP